MMDWYPKKSGERVAVEVALTSPNQEVKNVLDNFSCGGNISRVVVACRDKKMVEKVRKQIDQCNELTTFRDRVYIIPLSSFIKPKNERRS